MLTFDTPSYLILLALLPVMIYFKHFWRKRGNVLQFSFDIWQGFGFRFSSVIIKYSIIISSILFWIGVVLLIFSAAGPSVSKKEKVFMTRGIDIMFVIDESPSMSAMDMNNISRFESAKEIIRKFVRNRENDPIGVVSFSKEAALRIPPTLDYKSIINIIDKLFVMDLGDGSSIGMGVAVACLHLRSSTAEKKIIILLTDGENNSGEINPDTASDIALRMKIKIYSIGLGTEGEAPIEFKDPITGKLYRGTFRGGFNESLLKEISEATGGKYFQASSSSALESVFRTIDSIETAEKKFKIQVKKDERYERYILIGMILILIDFVFRKFVLREIL